MFCCLSLITNSAAEANGANCAACVLDRVAHQAAPLGSGVRTALSKCLQGVEWNTDPASCLAFPCSALAGLGSAQPQALLIPLFSPESFAFSVFARSGIFFLILPNQEIMSSMEGGKPCVTHASFFLIFRDDAFSCYKISQITSLVKSMICFENIIIFLNFRFWGLGDRTFKIPHAQ